jgi:hypothetical protein
LKKPFSPPNKPTKQKGGADEEAEPLSLEANLMGATIVALIAGGSLKGVIDYMMKE